MASVFDQAIAVARSDTAVELVAERFPGIRRSAHLRRLAGSARWMEIADGLVDAAPGFPEGYGLLSKDANHNQGQYAIRCPIGVLTVRREPHEDANDDGCYLQQALEGLDFDEGLDEPRPNAKVYLSVPPRGPAKLIVEHGTLGEPMKIGLEELSPKVEPIATPRQKRPARAVRSAKSHKGKAKDS